MKLTTIRSIKSNFSYKNVLKHLHLFLRKRVILSNIAMIILVIITILLGLVLIIAIDLVINDTGLLAREYLPVLSFEETIASHGKGIFYNARDSVLWDFRLGQETSNVKNKPCVFSPFIDLFNKNDSTWKYFPSFFEKDQFNLKLNQSNCAIDEKALLHYINYDQYFILEYRNNSYYCLISDLYDIVSDYIKSNNSNII